MTRRATERRCSRCGRTFPLTEQYWYFHKSGPRRGKPNGYCRETCHNQYCRDYGKMLTGARLAKRRLQQLDWQRRASGTDPERYRPSPYEAILAAADLAPTPLRAEALLEQQAAS